MEERLLVLNYLMRRDGGFEGNAQALRIISRLEKKLPKFYGLNLTERALLSIIKYYRNYN
jgi:dGTPase